MNNERLLLIRADAGGELGTGHVMRMLALAQAWQDAGGRVSFACASCPSGVLTRLEGEGFEVNVRAVEPGSIEDLRWTKEAAKGGAAGWVVLDGYHFRESFQLGLRDDGFRILAVDDYGHSASWAADAVLNGNLHAIQPSPHLAAGGLETCFLYGPRFALLRREFQLPLPPGECAGDGRLKVLVTFGGVDPPGAALRIAQALAPVASALPLRVRVLAGAANPRAANLDALARRHSDWLEAKPAVTNMPAEYTWADRVISAGGSSCLEWLRYRKPGWVLSIADNQHPILAAVRNQRLAFAAGRIEDYPDDDSLTSALHDWLKRPPLTPPPVVDPWGPARVVAWLDGTMLVVRSVDAMNEADVRFLFDLANEPTVRSAGFHNGPIPWETHVDWVRHHTASPASLLLCGEHHDLGRCAVVRFHQRAARDWEIGIAVSRAARGRGIARAAVDRGVLILRRAHPDSRVLATVKPDNVASAALFRSLSFRQTTAPHEDGAMTFELA